MTRVLVVEDEESLALALTFMLKNEGYEVATVGDGQLALDEYERNGADLILLDLMLPTKSGNEVCKAIRQTSSVPIIMLTAKDAEIDKVLGLELGADDYITKPYSSRELLARMQAVLRRQSGFGESTQVVDGGPVVLDLDRHAVLVRGAEVKVPMKEFELLELLMRNAGRVLTRDQIMDRVWGRDYPGDTKTLEVHIRRLRSKIEDDPAHPQLIQTIRGLGYRYEPAA